MRSKVSLRGDCGGDINFILKTLRIPKNHFYRGIRGYPTRSEASSIPICPVELKVEQWENIDTIIALIQVRNIGIILLIIIKVAPRPWISININYLYYSLSKVAEVLCCYRPFDWRTSSILPTLTILRGSVFKGFSSSIKATATVINTSNYWGSSKPARRSRDHHL